MTCSSDRLYGQSKSPSSIQASSPKLSLGIIVSPIEFGGARLDSAAELAELSTAKSGFVGFFIAAGA